MYPDEFFQEQETNYKLSNLLFGITLLGLVFLALYLLWRWCSETDTTKLTSTSDRMFMKPVYAHEIEPGIVVLQSEDGEYFKIMKEYDLSSSGKYGSVSCTRPETLQPSPVGPPQANTSLNGTGFSPGPFQPPRPTAPAIYHSYNHTYHNNQPPPYHAQ